MPKRASIGGQSPRIHETDNTKSACGCLDCTSDRSRDAMDDATLTPDAGAPSPPLPALLLPRALDAALAEKTTDPARRPRTPSGLVAAREWDVAHAAALRALLTQPPAVLPNQVGDPL